MRQLHRFQKPVADDRDGRGVLVAEQTQWSDGGYFTSTGPVRPPGQQMPGQPYASQQQYGAPQQFALQQQFAPQQQYAPQQQFGGPSNAAQYGSPPYGSHTLYPSSPRADGFAIASLVCGLILAFGGLFAVIFGHVSIARSRREGRSASGLAIAGLVLGYLGLLLILAAIAIPVFLEQRGAGYDASVKSDLRSAATAEEEVYTSTGSFTTDVDQLHTSVAAGNRVVVVGATGSSFCLEGSSQSPNVWYYSSTTGLSTTPCY